MPVNFFDRADGYLFDNHSGLSPEIAYFWDKEKDAQDQDRDWYIKGNGCVAVLVVTPFHCTNASHARRNGAASYDARYILRYV